MPKPVKHTSSDSFRIKEEKGKKYIFDTVRKKYVVLTPEEGVRQSVIRYLSNEKKFPLSHFQVEKGLILNGIRKRCDVLVSSRNGKPLILVECKSSNVKIDQETFDQIARYNLRLKVDYLMVTDGITSYFCQMDYDNHSYCFIKEIPDYHEIQP